MVTIWHITTGALFVTNVFMIGLAYHLYDRAVYFEEKFREERRRNINEFGKILLQGAGQQAASNIMDMFGLFSGSAESEDIDLTEDEDEDESE